MKASQLELNQNETPVGQRNKPVFHVANVANEANAAVPEQLLIALTGTNDRIQQLEDTIASLKAELRRAKAPKRSKIDLRWLAMA